ncbi:unnamed protein product (macronuclear) [Paramecium tetraurelia]|uniref:Uncharacterized protein n=1 Tax=Paramecium tetraurelia TaxID=5888 RepID=A0DDL2_PARTE|nr:uncharacterized protein GSPATT00039436001 [Paramecium tetraurelia]CAK81129.1 unnamed protein product [Paramecium tetraurelia]|eukprot:XP_001448526.1 hypothetical protein (macronuclear) [Paramecium tetraurelia strain d4-2]
MKKRNSLNYFKTMMGRKSILCLHHKNLILPGRFYKKPLEWTGRRIAMSPFFKNILNEDEEENFKKQEIFYDPHAQYINIIKHCQVILFN